MFGHGPAPEPPLVDGVVTANCRVVCRDIAWWEVCASAANAATEPARTARTDTPIARERRLLLKSLSSFHHDLLQGRIRTGRFQKAESSV